jgi:hypothetical protein
MRANPDLFMPRKLVHIALADSLRNLAEQWRRLGFAMDGQGIGFTLADGVRLEFVAGNDVAVAGLSAAPAELSDHEPAIPGAGPGFRLATNPCVQAASDHPNGARGVRAVAAIAEAPADHSEFLSKLTGQREMLATSSGLEIRLEGGARLDVLTAPAFAFRFGAAPAGDDFKIAGLVFAVGNLTATESMLREKGLEPRMQAGRLLAGVVNGVAVAFEQET